MWRIVWESDITGNTHRDEAEFENEADCQRECDRANSIFQGFTHWPEAV